MTARAWTVGAKLGLIRVEGFWLRLTQFLVPGREGDSPSGRDLRQVQETCV